jgi:hypothetical protein
MTPSQIARDATGFTVRATMRDSKIVRLDLPEFLDHPLELQSVSLHTAFAWRGNFSCRVMILALLVACACLAVPASTRTGRAPRAPTPEI